MKKTILVTGAAGFIGSHVTERLLENNYRVIGIDNFDPFYNEEIKYKNIANSLNSPNYVFHKKNILDIDFLQEESIDGIIHLAAKAGVRPSLENPESYIETNILGTQKLLEFAKQKQISKFIFASSSSVYGNNKTPFKETDNVDKPISVYAYTKKCGELMLQTYHHLYNLNFIAYRFFTVYGPRQRPDLAINKFVHLIKNEEPIPMYGDGSTGRDYTYISDIVDGIYAGLEYLYENEKVCEIINLGNNHPINLKDMIHTIYSVLNKKEKIIEFPKQPGDVEITYASIEKAKKLLNYQPKISFKKGIELYCKNN